MHSKMFFEKTPKVAKFKKFKFLKKLVKLGNILTRNSFGVKENEVKLIKAIIVNKINISTQKSYS